MKKEHMAAEREPDKWLERLLRRPSASSAAATPSGVCLDAETLAAWADGALDAKELASAEIHASNCPRCMALLAAIARTAPTVSAESRSRGALFRWLVPLAAAATAIAIWVAIPERQVTPVAREAATSAVAEPPPMTAPQPAEAPPVAAPQPKSVQPQQAARLDSPSSRTRDTEQGAREEREAALGATFAGRVAPAPATPAPSASADALSDKAAAPAPLAARRALNEAVTMPIEGVSATDPLIRWRSLSGADVERSTDGGQTWMKSASSPPGSIVTIHVVDALNATVTTSDGRSLSTLDGGATWAPVQEKPAAPF